MIDKGTKALSRKLEEKEAFCVLWILIGIYVAAFSFISFLKFNCFAYGDYDLAYFDQIVWNILHGSVYNSILGMVFLGVHVQTIWFLIAPLYLLLPHPTTLLFLQSLALGAAAYPLYLLTRAILGYRWGLLVSFMYLIYPAIGHMNLFELHSTAFAPFFLMSMFYFFHKERFGLFMLFLFLAVFCQENVSLAALGMGFYALCKRRGRKWVVVPVVAVGLYFLLCLKMILPYFNRDTVQFFFLYRHLGNSPTEIVVNMLKHPVIVLRMMFARRNLIFLGQLFGPLSFIPVLSPLWLLAALPLFAQHLLSSRISQQMIYYHYTAEIIPFVFVAFVFGLKNLLSLTVVRRYRFFLGYSLLLISLISAYRLGPQFKLLRLAAVYQKDDYSRQKEAFLKQVPPRAPVVATFEFLPHLTHRPELYSFHHQYMGFYSMSSRPYRLPDTVRYALLDFDDGLTFRSFYSPEGYKNTQELLSRGRWGVVDVKDNIVLFEKDAENKYVLFKILPSEPQPGNKIVAEVTRDIEFLGFDIQTGTPHVLHTTFYWKSLNKTKKDLSVFLDVIDNGGNIVLRVVRPLCYRIYPTNAWVPGQWISEEAYLTLPSSLAPGRYSLAMGFFDYSGGKGYLVNPQDPLGRIFLKEIYIGK